MKFAVLFNLMFLLAGSQAQVGISEETELAMATQLQSVKTLLNGQGNKKVLRRSIRNVFSNLEQTYTSHLEKIIINNCKTNNQSEAAEKLQPIFDEAKACLRKKKIIETPKEEYLAFIEECRIESVNKTKSCLAESQRYFPDAILELSKSVANFLYDDVDILREDVVNCLPKLSNFMVVYKYKQCLRDVSIRTNDTLVIKDSKAKFCMSLIPAAYCFSDMIKDNCDETPGIVKFGKDYIEVHKQICNGETEPL